MLFSACLLPLIAWAILGVGYYFFFFSLSTSPGCYIASACCSLTLIILWGGLRNILLGNELLSALKKAEAREKPVDGKITAVTGTVHPIREALTSPIFGTRCIAYDYEAVKTISYRSNGKSHTREDKYFTGFCLTPSVIRSLSDTYKLLGFASLDDFGSDATDSAEESPEAYKHFKEYIDRTPGEDASGVKVTKAIASVEELLTDDDGSIKVDWRPNALDIPFEELELEEHAVPVGAEITAFGIYSETKKGLVPQTGMKPFAVQLHAGNTAHARKNVKSQARTALIFSVIFFAAAHGISFGVFKEDVPNSMEVFLNRYPVVREYMNKINEQIDKNF